MPAGSASPNCAPCNDGYRPLDRLRRRALDGPDQEVYFPQEHPPGREAQLDFTHGNSLGVTTAGQPYPHLLFQLILSHSGWRYAEIATGETFLALEQGMQNALWTLGGVPEVVRSDNTSAGTRINRGKSHENGVAEHAHYRLKDAIEQTLILRGSRDFHTADDYAQFVQQMVEKRYRLVKGKLAQELACPGPCRQPPCRNTPTTSPGCACGGLSKWRDGVTACPPGSSTRRSRSACTPTGWKSTTRATTWSAWRGCTVREK